ncbi:MAG: ATPase [Alphaproteobacteria bacterium]|nr:ATPase [Alphaproteobacteria bacterium]
MCQRVSLVAAGVWCLFLTTAKAEIVASGPGGFSVHHSVHVFAGPVAAYRVLVSPRLWWSSDHTYSHDASNLSLDPRAGGCWCEALPNGGSVQHMTVALAMPGKLLRLKGALGPLQGLGVEAAMTVTLTPTGSGSDVGLDYVVGGYSTDGLEKLARPVDHVLGEQLARLKQAIEAAH